MAGAGSGGAEAEDEPRIAIRLQSVAQLFSSLDPSPWPEKDLAADVDLHFREWAAETAGRGPPRIRVELPAGEAARPEAGAIGPAIAFWYRSRAEAHRAELRELLRIGRLSLLIGLLTLALCTLGSRNLAPLVPHTGLAQILADGLVILGWVALWRPMEIYLYDWWPIRQRRRLCERLAAARVEVRAAG
jgi:hypothetical protein